MLKETSSRHGISANHKLVAAIGMALYLIDTLLMLSLTAAVVVG